MTNLEFVKRVLEIAETEPTYRTGGDGSDGTCDCIGLIIGALGKEYDLHSSNYFARYQMRVLDNLLDEAQLHPGAIVYKSRRDTSDLNARYQPGGRYYNGDMLDYYHVGVVTNIDPLTITHCTSTNSINGMAYDASIGAWSHFGDLLDVEPGEMQEEETMLQDLAVVYSEDGNPVRMRKAPTTASETIVKVPKGAQVEVTESADGWSTILWNGKRGYMMSEFLRVIGVTPAEDDTVFEAKVLAKLDEILTLLKGGAG